jgi:hypothetical protein
MPALASLMKSESMTEDAYKTIRGIYSVTYGKKGCWFRMPEAWDHPGTQFEDCEKTHSDSSTIATPGILNASLKSYATFTRRPLMLPPYASPATPRSALLTIITTPCLPRLIMVQPRGKRFAVRQLFLRFFPLMTRRDQRTLREP